MAQANSRSTDAPRDAITLLKQDHRNVEQLFEQFEDADEAQQSAIATRICELLTVHAQIEEEILYPAAKQTFEEEESYEDIDLVNEANVEHASAKDLIAQIEAMTPEHEAFRATVTVLGEYIKHHVKEEEGELFPLLKDSQLDLKELGTQLLERKVALMEELGIDDKPLEIPSGRAGRNPAARGGARRGGSSRPSTRSARH